MNYSEFESSTTGKTSISVFIDNDIRVVSGTPSQLADLRRLLATGGPADEIRSQLNRLERLNQKLSVADVEVDDGPVEVKIHEDGRVTVNDAAIDSSLTTKIIEMVEDNEDAAPLVRFLERLVRNPSDHSREQAYDWLVNHDFQITEDGLIVGYKGVREDGKSLYSGVEEITISQPSAGYSWTETGRISNGIGTVVSMNRSLVDTNPRAACSRGLHVGTHGYATSYGNVLRVVLVDPADICSVPTDAGGRKIRVCRYQVVADAEGGSLSLNEKHAFAPAGLTAGGDVSIWKEVVWNKFAAA